MSHLYNLVLVILHNHLNVYYRNEYDTNSRDFLGGINRNLNTIKKYFPGFIMRLYYHVPPKSAFLKQVCILACSVPNFDLCDIENIPNAGNIIIILNGLLN